MIIENVDWHITSSCNRSCLYCYGPKNITHLSFSNAKKVVDLLKEHGTKQIGLTGGEPLLYPYIDELIEYITDQGIRVYLSTNCDYYNNHADVIKTHVDILGVPLDGHNSSMHDFYRGSGNFGNVINAMNDIARDITCKTVLKIGTVVTNHNYHIIKDIERILYPYDQRILFWKLYELIAYPHNRINIDSLKVDIDLENPNNTTKPLLLPKQKQGFFDRLTTTKVVVCTSPRRALY